MSGLAGGMRRGALAGCVVLAVSVGLPAVAGAATFSVTGTSDGTAPCSGTACPTLRSAVLAADALGGRNTITVPAGRYDLSLRPSGPDDGATGDLHITSNLEITGAGRDATVIIGEGDRIFDITAAHVTLMGLQLRHGSQGFGGAVSDHGENGSLNLTDDEFIANAAGGVAGAVGLVPSNNGILTITHSIFRSNLAGDPSSGASGFGGAIFFAPGNGKMTVASSEFDSNLAQAGATSGGAGGAIAFEPSNAAPLTITGSTFAANVAAGGTSGFAVGGAILYETGDGGFESPLRVTNSTFVGNRAGGQTPNSVGGAIDNEPAGPPDSVVLTQVTMVGNQVGPQGFGGGIFNNGGLTIANSIISGNVGAPGANNCSGGAVPVGHNIELGTSCGFDINADPMLLPLSDNGGPTRTMAIKPSSPAHDAADPAYCPATDQRGVARPDDPGTPCDIGAYELVSGG